jgi:hypothetical protein
VALPSAGGLRIGISVEELGAGAGIEIFAVLVGGCDADTGRAGAVFADAAVGTAKACAALCAGITTPGAAAGTGP